VRTLWLRESAGARKRINNHERREKEDADEDTEPKSSDRSLQSRMKLLIASTVRMISPTSHRKRYIANDAAMQALRRLLTPGVAGSVTVQSVTTARVRTYAVGLKFVKYVAERARAIHDRKIVTHRRNNALAASRGPPAPRRVA